MFTGIVEEIGLVKEIRKSGQNAFIVVECKQILNDVKIGDSISIDGVCQTVTNFSSNSFSAEVSSETLEVTNFSKLKTGAIVNLERALTLSSRLGGHIVSGHIDGLVKVNNIKKVQSGSAFFSIIFEVENFLAKYIVKKGSVTLNGISLTVVDVSSTEFSVVVIPHTFENSSLKSLKIGDFVNIEVDILAKYVEKILLKSDNGDETEMLNKNFLKENGFL